LFGGKTPPAKKGGGVVIKGDVFTKIPHHRKFIGHNP